MALSNKLKSLRFLHLEFEGSASPEKTFDLDAALPKLHCLHVSSGITTWCIDSVSGLLPHVPHAACHMIPISLDSLDMAKFGLLAKLALRRLCMVPGHYQPLSFEDLNHMCQSMPEAAV